MMHNVSSTGRRMPSIMPSSLVLSWTVCLGMTIEIKNVLTPTILRCSVPRQEHIATYDCIERHMISVFRRKCPTQCVINPQLVYLNFTEISCRHFVGNHALRSVKRKV